MRKCVLLAILPAGLGLLAAAPLDAQRWGCGYYRAAYYPAYYYPPPAYQMPASYYAPPVYARAARPVVEVGAYDGRGFEPVDVHGMKQYLPSVGRIDYSLSKMRSTTQQPRTCSPAWRQWASMSASRHPASSRASANTGRRSKARSS